MADKQSGVIDIHGKSYETVALRIKKFRDSYPDWTMLTQIIDRTEDSVVMVATIMDEAGRVRATGHAEEQRRSSQINKTSALENCETSAIGRCLATLGLGGTEFASADEVKNAIHQQGHKPSDGAEERVSADRKNIIIDASTEVKDLLLADDDYAAYEVVAGFTDPDEKVFLWSFLGSKERKRLKDQAAKAKETA